MKRTKLHRLKLVLSRARWALEASYYAIRYFREVREYKFLLTLRDDTKKKMLAVGRKEASSPLFYRLQGQVEILDGLLNYGK